MIKYLSPIISRKIPPKIGNTMFGYEYTEYSKFHCVYGMFKSASIVFSIGPGLS